MFSRIAAALFGGYVVAALVSVAVLALPLSKQQAVLTGMLASFLVYAAVVVWVFAARSHARAWFGVLLVAAPLLMVVYLTAPQALVDLTLWLRGAK